MLTLGIETSCDETGVSITEGRRVLSNIVSSSVHLHKIYGGVVPEIASRFHVEYVIEVLSKALARSGKKLGDMKLVAVTNGPGLVGALLVGISVAKSIAYSLDLPLVGANHILAHLYSAFLNPVRKKFSNGVNDKAGRPDFPFVGLVVSGGHTALFLCEAIGRQRLLGQTQDDAVGEAFDKVAKLLGLGYPGGPIIEKTARSSKGKSKINFPKSYMGKDSLDFSFSGLKTAVLYYVRDPAHEATGGAGRVQGVDKNKESIADICFAFQEAALDVLVEKALLACEMNNIKKIVIGGGVAANSILRKKLLSAAGNSGTKVYFPEIEYCMDNAAMIGALGEELYKRGCRDNLYLTAEPNLEVTGAE